MKLNRIILSLLVITVLLMCNGLVAALSSEEAAAHALFSTQPLSAGQKTTVALFFSSTAADDLVITYVGIHFDWLPAGSFVGFDLSNTPVTVSAGGSHVFQDMAIQVPTNIASGAHTYFIGIEGLQGSSSTPFSWDSVTSSVEIIGGSASVSPSVTNSGGGQQPDQSNLLLYGVVGAIIVIVVLLIIALLVRKKRAHPKPNTTDASDQQETPSSDQKSNSEQDFAI